MDSLRVTAQYVQHSLSTTHHLSHLELLSINHPSRQTSALLSLEPWLPISLILDAGFASGVLCFAGATDATVGASPVALGCRWQSRPQRERRESLSVYRF